MKCNQTIACSLLFLSLTLPALSNGESQIWPMPGAPHGENTAAFPAPKLDWVERVKNTNERARNAAKDIELVFDGDSITDSFSSSERGRDIWNARYAKYHAFNFAISGDRTEHVLWRLSQGQIDNLHPKLIVLLIGTNNLGRNTSDEIAEGIKAIIEEYRKCCPDAVILLQAIFPRGQRPNEPNRTKIKDINHTIAKLDDGRHIIFIDFGNKFLGQDGTLSPDTMPDFLHPNRKGYEIWANAIQPLIDRYVGS